MLTCSIPVMYSIRVENSVDPDQMADFDAHCFNKDKSGFSRARVNIVTFPLFINRLSIQILTNLVEWPFILENRKNKNNKMQSFYNEISN